MLEAESKPPSPRPLMSSIDTFGVQCHQNSEPQDHERGTGQSAGGPRNPYIDRTAPARDQTEEKRRRAAEHLDCQKCFAD